MGKELWTWQSLLDTKYCIKKQTNFIEISVILLQFGVMSYTLTVSYDQRKALLYSTGAKNIDKISNFDMQGNNIKARLSYELKIWSCFIHTCIPFIYFEPFRIIKTSKETVYHIVFAFWSDHGKVIIETNLFVKTTSVKSARLWSVDPENKPNCKIWPCCFKKIKLLNKTTSVDPCETWYMRNSSSVYMKLKSELPQNCLYLWYAVITASLTTTSWCWQAELCIDNNA